MSSAVAFGSFGTPERIGENPAILLVTNPASRLHNLADQQIQAYRANGMLRHWSDRVETLPNPDETIDRLHTKLSHPHADYDAIVCLTGDGGANPVAQYLHDEASSLPLYLGGYGTINDGHRSTVGPQEKGLLSHQPLVDLYPLLADIDLPTGERVRRLALLYQSIGYTALAAQFINTPRHRQHPLTRFRGMKKIPETLTVLRALRDTKPFTLTDASLGKQQSRDITELTLVNGSRMAGMPIYPGDLTSRGFHTLETRNKPAIASSLGKLMIRQKSDWQPADYLRFTLHADQADGIIPYQFDGETMDLPSGTTLTLRASAQSIRVVAPALAHDRSYT